MRRLDGKNHCAYEALACACRATHLVQRYGLMIVFFSFPEETLWVNDRGKLDDRASSLGLGTLALCAKQASVIRQ